MLIWTRWGLLVVLALVAGALLGSSTLSALGIPPKTPGATMSLMFWYGAAASLALTLWVFPRLDRPRPATITRRLAEPTRDEQGRLQRFETVPVLDPEGNQISVAQPSTLFFIPARFYWVFFVIVAIVATVEWIFRA